MARKKVVIRRKTKRSTSLGNTETSTAHTARAHSRRTTLERFLERVEVQEDGCWLWTGPPNGSGRPNFSWGGRTSTAYRFSYEHYVGPIPRGKVLDHVVCERPMCVNYAHVKPVTQRDNARRSDYLAAKIAQKFCIWGHAFNKANTYVKSNGTRQCRKCNARRQRERRARKSSSDLWSDVAEAWRKWNSCKPGASRDDG